MDNASKALVMVGAILIAVMLISLGVFLFTYARDAAEGQTDRMDEMTISAFNQQFTSYLGPNIKGSSVKALISIANPAGVKVKNGSASGAVVNSGNVISSNSYTLQEHYASTGQIDEIYITAGTLSGM
ncbi:MAG: hypothetical protein IKK43_04360 [Clostridia bacterium]|nr:hypothetical protein [Clostridia bacterium]